MTINKEMFGGKPVILFVVEKQGKGQPPFPEVPYQADGVWLRLRISGKSIVGQFRENE